MKSGEEKKAPLRRVESLDGQSDTPYNENLTPSKEGIFVVSGTFTLPIPEEKYPN
jgi:hypothetical protein